VKCLSFQKYLIVASGVFLATEAKQIYDTIDLAG